MRLRIWWQGDRFRNRWLRIERIGWRRWTLGWINIFDGHDLFLWSLVFEFCTLEQLCPKRYGEVRETDGGKTFGSPLFDSRPFHGLRLRLGLPPSSELLGYFQLFANADKEPALFGQGFSKS